MIIRSGVHGFDELIGEPFSIPCVIALSGDLGAGKSLLAQQITWNLLGNGFTILYECIDRPPSYVAERIKRFGWNVEPLLNKKLFFKDYTSGFTAEEMIADENRFLDVHPERPLLLIVDSMTLLMIGEGAEKIIALLREKVAKIHQSNLAAIFISHAKAIDETMRERFRILADYVFHMTAGEPRTIELIIGGPPTLDRTPRFYLISDRGIEVLGKTSAGIPRL